MSAKYLLSALSILILAACAAPLPTIKTQKALANVGVVSLFTDELRGGRSDGWKTEPLPLSRVAWSTNHFLTNHIRQVLASSGIQVATATYDDANLQKLNVPDSSGELAQVIAAAVTDREAFDALVVVYPNYIDGFGRQHSVLRNFMLMGPVGVAIGEQARKQGAYSNAYQLMINIGLHEKMIGKSRCVIGFDLSVVDAKTNTIIGQKRSVIGREEVPSEIWAPSFDAFREKDQGIVKEKCLSALAKAVTQALMAVGLPTRP